MTMSSLKCKRQTTVHWKKKLREQWKSGLNCDGELVISNETIKIQRCVLAAACTYFRVLFSSDFKEKHLGTINLTETFDCIDTMRDIIGFIYGDSIKVTEENVERILRYSDILNLEEVRQHGLTFLLQNLTIQNCLWTWSLASMFGFTELKVLCKEYAECYLLTIAKFEETLSLTVEQLKIFLEEGLAKQWNSVQMLSFIDDYIAFDPVNRISCRKEIVKEIFSGNLQLCPRQRSEFKDAEHYDEAVLFQGRLENIWLIYSVRENCWYSGEHVYKSLGIGQRITTVAIGPDCDYIMPEGGDLFNVNTLQRLPINPTLYGGPYIADSKMQAMHMRNYRGLFALVWMIPTSSGFQNYPYPNHGQHGFYLYELDLCRRRWQFLQTVYESKEHFDCSHFIQSNEDNMYILLVRHSCILIYHFAALTRKLSKLKTFHGDAFCAPRWEIFANSKVIVLMNEAKEKSLHYCFSSDQWSTHSAVNLTPNETDTGMKKFNGFVKSKASGRVFMMYTKNGLRTHFASYDPLMREFTVLHAVPFELDGDFFHVEGQWQRVPRKFFSYLKPAKMMPKVKKRVLSSKVVEKTVDRYKRRMKNECELTTSDEEGFAFSVPILTNVQL